MKPFLLCLSLALPVQAAISIDGYTPLLHDRFANDPSFIGTGLDFSGVGRLPSSTPSSFLSWGTLVSRNVFLAASHTSPAIGGTITFYTDNDPNSTPITRTVVSTVAIGGSDLMAGVLDTPVPATIATYSYETQTIGNIAGANVEGENAYLSGLTPNTIPTPYNALGATTNQSVGRNVIDDYLAGEIIFGRPTDLIAVTQDLLGDPDFTAHEAHQQGGDSGAPLFVDDGMGGLRIAGITSAIGTNGLMGPDLRNISFYAYAGNYSDGIDTVIANNPVPEPSTAGLLLLSMSFLMRRRTR